MSKSQASQSEGFALSTATTALATAPRTALTRIAAPRTWFRTGLAGLFRCARLFGLPDDTVASPSQPLATIGAAKTGRPAQQDHSGGPVGTYKRWRCLRIGEMLRTPSLKRLAPGLQPNRARVQAPCEAFDSTAAATNLTPRAPSTTSGTNCSFAGSGSVFVRCARMMSAASR